VSQLYHLREATLYFWQFLLTTLYFYFEFMFIMSIISPVKDAW